MVDAVKIATPNRFDLARQAAAEAATTGLAIEAIAAAVQTQSRCISLLMPARIAGALGNTVNKAEVSRALSGVIRDLQEVVSELGE